MVGVMESHPCLRLYQSLRRPVEPELALLLFRPSYPDRFLTKDTYLSKTPPDELHRLLVYALNQT